MGGLAPDVLVVDDDAVLRTLIVRTLQVEGYRVRAAASVAGALRAVEGGVPDLVVSDVMMPDVTGYELLEQLRGDPASAAVPVIFLSALGDATSVDRGRRLGVDHYLVKPFTPQQLLAAVSGTLRRYAELRQAQVIVRPGATTAVAAPRGFEPIGVGPVDEQVGGLSRGRVYLVAGDFGAAKTLLGLQFLHAALARGERAVLVTVERLDTLLYAGASAGLALRDHVRDGSLAVFALAPGFERLLETRDDLVALTAEIAAHVRDAGAARLVVGSTLTMLCSTPRLTASAPLMGELVGGLEAAGVTTLLVADEPVTHQEQLTEAYLRRTVFGTLVVGKDGSGTGRGVLQLDGMVGVTTTPEARPFRIVHGLGLATANLGAEPDLYDRLAQLRERAELALARGDGAGGAVVACRERRWRLRDPVVLHVRECMRIALQTTEQWGFLLVRFAFDVPDGGRRPTLAPADVDGLLSGQEVLCWVQASDLAVLVLGGGRPAPATLQDRLVGRLRDVARVHDGRLAACEAVAVTCPEDGETADALLASLQERLTGGGERARADVARA
jgi:CheY-like chemotaxis protein/KaiC/GvpD/RAD55 family RecA-like ATPase